ncbi:uncharacterized protein LOC129579372 [Sitodiplosis mosellana]|uniref:uncharacterized protein LOC129579372 n=1 Tax=Sitodiplosis mosellana TaxID=263140 RepID=UPI0024446F7E|nr:uncharacterized protein LOC129579372 [Sitodiplosis mosellana]
MSAEKRSFESDSEESDTSKGKRVKKPSPTAPIINSFQNAVSSIHTLCAFIAAKIIRLNKEDLDKVLTVLNNGIKRLESARKSLNVKKELYKNDGAAEFEMESPYKNSLVDESTTQIPNTDEVIIEFTKKHCKFIRKIFVVIASVTSQDKHTIAKIFAFDRTFESQMPL